MQSSLTASSSSSPPGGSRTDISDEELLELRHGLPHPEHVPIPAARLGKRWRSVSDAFGKLEDENEKGVVSHSSDLASALACAFRGRGAKRDLNLDLGGIT
jgi:hypothetical protein